MADQPTICVVKLKEGSASETFIRAHEERLPAHVVSVSGLAEPHMDGRPILPQNPVSRAWRKAGRTI
ncbi:MAG TPA: hypothetical protein VLV86_11775, partial [Vicinamibacterales bacterium]|nr:hypothetical protein [Vicinamibacterales bacterium]